MSTVEVQPLWCSMILWSTIPQINGKDDPGTSLVMSDIHSQVHTAINQLFSKSMVSFTLRSRLHWRTELRPVSLNSEVFLVLII